MKSEFAKLAATVLLTAVAIGCGSGGSAMSYPSGAATMSATGETAALTAAGADYTIALDTQLQIGDFIATPVLGEWFGFWVWTDKTNFGLDVSSKFYRNPVQGTGWTAFDDFDIREEGYTANVSYYSLNDSSDDISGWMVGGGYMYPLGSVYLKGDIKYGVLDSDINIFAPSLRCDYYITDVLSVGLSWDYEHYKEDSWTFSQNLFRLNVGYKIVLANPVLLKFAYGKLEENGSDWSVRNVVVGADWMLQDKWLVSMAVVRWIDDENWANWYQAFKPSVGYRLNDNATVNLGGSFFWTSDDDDRYRTNGVQLGYSQTF